MADDIVIRAEGLGKKYIIGHQAPERVATLRDAISRNATNFGRTTRDLVRGKPLIAGDEVEEFWALNDVNFEIRRGEVVGIIGRNGAGKSTLLKILSRITEPSEGRVEIRGRVASLLEVGTGFHPELTGRENIFLNGAILGMSRAEVRRKFDEIVSFAEIEKFLDTPVKRYSSGMYVRLAFAVAAHLDPEILIVDEVLAVGDAEFQKKCLAKMEGVAGEGRTVLFVSHNISAITALTNSAILLSNGRVAATGCTSDVINSYIKRQDSDAADYKRKSPPAKTPYFEYIKISNSTGSSIINTGETVDLIFGIHFPQPQIRPCLSFQIYNSYDHPVIHQYLYSPDFPKCEAGDFAVHCKIESLNLNIGSYYLKAYLSEPPRGAHWETLDQICHFQVVRSDPAPYWGWRRDVCAYFVNSKWTFSEI